MFLNPDVAAFNLISERLRTKIRERIPEVSGGTFDTAMKLEIKNILVGLREEFVKDYSLNGDRIKFAVKITASGSLVIDIPNFIHRCDDCVFLGNSFKDRVTQVDSYWCTEHERVYPTLIARDGHERFSYELIDCGANALEHQNGLILAKLFYEDRENIMSI